MLCNINGGLPLDLYGASRVLRWSNAYCPSPDSSERRSHISTQFHHPSLSLHTPYLIQPLERHQSIKQCHLNKYSKARTVLLTPPVTVHPTPVRRTLPAVLVPMAHCYCKVWIRQKLLARLDCISCMRMLSRLPSHRPPRSFRSRTYSRTCRSRQRSRCTRIF